MRCRLVALVTLLLLLPIGMFLLGLCAKHGDRQKAEVAVAVFSGYVVADMTVDKITISKDIERNDLPHRERERERLHSSYADDNSWRVFLRGLDETQDVCVKPAHFSNSTGCVDARVCVCVCAVCCERTDVLRQGVRKGAQRLEAKHRSCRRRSAGRWTPGAHYRRVLAGWRDVGAWRRVPQMPAWRYLRKVHIDARTST